MCALTICIVLMVVIVMYIFFNRLKEFWVFKLSSFLIMALLKTKKTIYGHAGTNT